MNPEKTAMSRGLLALFSACGVLVCARLVSPNGALAGEHWPEALLLILATLTTLASAASELPLQNLASASLIIGALGFAMHALARMLNLAATAGLGSGELWAAPVVWVAIILNSRKLARLVLGPNRPSSYGLWLIGLATMFATLSGLGVETLRACLVDPSAVWSVRWQIGPFDAAGAGLSLVLATPALLNKKPAAVPAQLDALCVWLVMHFLFATAAWRLGARLMAMVIVVCNLGISALVLRRQRYGTRTWIPEVGERSATAGQGDHHR